MHFEESSSAKQIGIEAPDLNESSLVNVRAKVGDTATCTSLWLTAVALQPENAICLKRSWSEKNLLLPMKLRLTGGKFVQRTWTSCNRTLSWYDAETLMKTFWYLSTAEVMHLRPGSRFSMPKFMLCAVLWVYATSKWSKMKFKVFFFRHATFSKRTAKLQKQG